MVKTHLPAHMDSVRQKLRPKHQLLILKCYPRLPKNSSADVRPNGSELSYLLYYASTRRSKLQKVGSFLEKKTARDVYNQQSARVLVTLMILTALLENKGIGGGSGFALIAPYVMRIVSGILESTSDISLIEATQQTWAVFCEDQDQASLAADHEYRELYEKLVGQYAELAHKAGAKKLGRSTTPVASHDAIRLRETGLHALKSVIQSEVLAYESGRLLLGLTIPAVLSNLRGDDAAYLQRLVRLTRSKEDREKDETVNRRQSMATVRTYTGTESSVEIDPRSAEGTAQDADAIAEEGVASLALDCLKAVFMTDNRAQIRSATSSLLGYLSDLQNYRRPQTSEKQISTMSVDSWAVKIFELCTAWTPVQDRFVLLVTAVEKLIHLPLKERDMRQHVLHIALIDDILRSDLNLIGLSIMDVLLGLIQQTLRILQYGNQSTAATPLPTSSGEDLRPATSATAITAGVLSVEARLRLIDSLKACIANLATHVYYTDQISDMISAILLRLKPSPASVGQQNPVVTAIAIEEPKFAVNEVASNASFPTRDRSNSTSGFFSFDVAREVALDVVRDIIKVANSSRAQNSGGVADSRNPVHISIWEGTQWLMRDPSSDVRMAYTDALITWLELETKKSDFRLDVPKPSPKKRAQEASAGGAAGNGGTLARRAVSNASATKDRIQKSSNNKKTSSQQTFLQLLHLAIYENALQFAATSKRDVALQHTLLATLIKRLGVNAVSSGLPMIFALQEEIARVESPVGKVRIGTLVHGYLWAVVEVFDCGHEAVGRAVVAEVTRRKDHGTWLSEVEYPPLPLLAIKERTQVSEQALGQQIVKHEELKAFDEREALVEAVLDHYQQTSAVSPAPSAPGSPGRSFTLPSSLDRTASGYLSAKQLYDPQGMSTAREAMMSSWSRQDCLAAIAALAPKSVSLSGSRVSPTQALAAAVAAGGGNHRQLLAAANLGPLRNSNGLGTPPKPVGAQRQQAFGAGTLDDTRLHSQSPDRRPSGSSIGKGSSSAAAKGPVRVEELKRVLAKGAFTPLSSGAASTKRYRSPSREAGAADDTASESMVTADDDLGSEDGYVAAAPASIGSTGKLSGRGGKGGVKDLSVLLEGIRVDDGEVRRLGVGRPPY